jgi:hypothetical protein
MLNAAKYYADTKAARFTAINTNSISTTLAANNTLKSDINLSNVNTNILTIDENGLSAKTELTFDPLTSILSFDNGIKKVDYHLTTNSLVSDVKYDQDGRLILVIQNVDGTTSEVVVQLDKLVGDNSGNSPIVISVSDSQNGIRKISASLSILSNDTNLIKQQNGSLYASKVASDHVGTYRDKQMTMQEVLGRIIEEIDGAENKIALKADKDSIPTKISDLINDNGFLSSIPSEYITEGELASRNFATYEQLSVKANKTDIPSLDGYAKESWVSAKIAEMAANGEIDLSGYATEDWVKDQRYLKQGDVDLSAYATKLELSGKADSSTVQQIRTDLNTLIGSDSDAVINKFNEIVSFLAGIEETETLDGLLNSIITEINKKADASSVPTKLSDLATDETNTVNLSCGEY